LVGETGRDRAKKSKKPTKEGGGNRLPAEVEPARVAMGRGEERCWEGVALAKGEERRASDRY